MNYRMATLSAETAYTADEVVKIDIDLLDPISEIVMMLKTYNSLTDTEPTAHFIAGISKIELIDGSDVLYSLDGYEAQALDYYDRGNVRSPWNAYLGANYGDIQVGMNFGRYLWDRELAFDASKFNNPRLEVSLDVGAGGVASTSLKLEVLASVFDDRKVAPRGFLMNKEIKDYEMGSATHEYTVMPTDYSYRKMFVKALKVGEEPNQMLNTLKLTEEGDKKIPFKDETFDNILRTIASTRPPVQEHILQWIGAASTNGYCIPTTRVFGQVTDWHSSHEIGDASFYNGDGGRYQIDATTAAGECQVFVTGYYPHGVIEIPFGMADDINDWYNVAKLGSLKADIVSKAGGDGDSCQIFLQQYRPY